jgi:hypothetical protein
VSGRPVHELAVVLRALLRARRRSRVAPEPIGRDALERLLAALPGDAVDDARVVDVPADRPPWHDTGIALRAGDTVTTFAVGRVYLSRLLDVWVGPPFQLWFRAGGDVFRGTRATNTFTAAADASLELASYVPGEWSEPDGSLGTDAREYRRMKGGMVVLVVCWAPGADSEAMLRQVSADDTSGLAAAELDRRATSVPEPDGWQYLWYLGRSEIYRADDAHIHCDTHGDVGILQRDVEVPLTDDTRLRWSWRVDELPSELAEDTLPTHDYLSVALEFDNGQDLTWHWSAELEPGRSYRCPLPTWKDKETHMVVRSGTADLGRWVSEEVAVRRDYESAVGTPPARIVRAWLIANSLSQRGRGRCAYRDIELVDGERTVRVL